MRARSQEAIRRHYEIEVKLADRLRQARAVDRPKLYASVYDELFRSVPDHPQLREQAGESERRALQKWRLVRKHLKRETRFLEIGAGDGALSRLAAPRVRSLVALEVSEEIIKRAALPSNARIVIGDGVAIPLADAGIDVAYSNQVLEHFHPDDAVAHLREISRVLAPAGSYICVTPNRFSGPHDISSSFDLEAKGLHLKEYAFMELIGFMRAAGFRRFKAYAGGKGFYLPSPVVIVAAIEKILAKLPRRVNRFLARIPVIRAFLGIVIVAVK